MAADTPTDHFDPATTTRPIPVLLRYYTIVSLLTLVAFPIVFVAHYCKYRSLRYRFDEEGISMSWGILFKREVYLTFRRIQDIHVSRNIIQRHLRLATVSVQTASGTAGAEMSIEGIGDPEGLRDYLYSRMRGSVDDGADAATAEGAVVAGDHADEALTLLREILEQVRSLGSRGRAGEVNDGGE
jgi:putative membrane protein